MPEGFLQKALRGMVPPQRTPQMVQQRGTAANLPVREGRGTMSGFVQGINPLWGQPYPEQAAGSPAALISRERMREVILRTPTAAACTNAILDFAGGVKIGVRNIDASKPVPKIQANLVNRLLRRPNSNQTKRQFILTLMRDLISFGYGAIELVPTGNATYPVEMWVMDSARLKIDFDEHGYIRGYDMLNARGVPIVRNPTGASDGVSVSDIFPQGMNMGYTGQPSYSAPSDSHGADGLHGWEPQEVIYLSINPISESNYPYSRVVQLYTAALLEDMMMQFISERFTDSNIPFGVFDLGDVSEDELRTAIDNWNTQGRVGSRVVMTGSKGAGSKWIPFGYHLKDLEATQLLSELRMKIMGILGVTMQELGESQDVNKSNGYNLSFTFKKRAIEPLLDEITETLTHRLLHDTLGFMDLEFYYEEIDSRDDFLMSQIDTNYQKLGILTPNEIRNRKGLTSVEGGEDTYIFTGNSWIPLDLARKMAEQILEVEAQTTAISVGGPEGFRVREPTGPGNNTSGPAKISHAPASANGKASQSHGKPGASSTMQRDLAGKSNGHRTTDWFEVSARRKKDNDNG